MAVCVRRTGHSWSGCKHLNRTANGAKDYNALFFYLGYIKKCINQKKVV